MLQLLGDVHAGREFVNDVPLHRRGEREREVMDKLEFELMGAIPGTHVQVGDLFDKFEVSNNVVWEVATIYIDAAHKNPKTNYILYPGNHDRSRDSGKISSLQIFELMTKFVSNITVFWTPTVIKTPDGNYGILPWHPFKTADDLARKLLTLESAYDFSAVLCHCDIDGSGNNRIPLEILEKVTRRVITGHVHIPQVYHYNNVEVVVTGSMQPYSHGEDKEGKRYVTLTKDELELSGSDWLRDKYVRVRLKEGETIQEVPDCMGFKTVKEAAENEAPKLDVKFEDFSTRSLFLQCLSEQAVDLETQELVLDRFDDTE